jgi:hypothetical protein
MKKDLIKAGFVLAAGFAALMLFTSGATDGNGLKIAASVFLGLWAWCAGYKWSQDERDRKSGIDKAVKDELKYNSDHERA